MSNTGTTGFIEIVNSNMYIPFSTASNYDMVLRTDQIQQRMFLGNTNNSSNMPALILSSNNIVVGNSIFSPGTSNRIWDFSGTISDTSLKPGPVGKNFINGSNITVSPLSPFSNINTEGSIYLPGITGNYINIFKPNNVAPISDITIETWIFLPVTPSNVFNGYNMPILFGNQSATAQTTYWSMGVNSSQYLCFFNNGSNYAAAPLTPINNNIWYHIAICYSNSPKTMQMFINGILQTLSTWGPNTSGSNTTTATFNSGISYGILNNSQILIGQNTNAALNAYVTNLRVVNNVLYTSSFTPSPYPLQVWGSNNTQLLLRAPLYNPIEHINSIQTYDSLRTHCLPSDTMIYADCYGTSLPNLSVSNAPLFDSNISQSIVFNRANSNYISFAPQTFNVATKGFTCITKFMFTSNPSVYERFFEGGNGTTSNIIFSRNGANNTLLFYLLNGGNFNTILQSTFNFNQNSIYTIACKYDPFLNNDKTNFFGNMSLFVNGSNVSNSNMGSTVGNDRILNNIYIANNGFGQPTFNGNIYNLAVYNRALTDKEIIDASMALNSTPSLPNQSTVEIGSASGKPALTVKNDGTLQIAGPINATNNQSYYPMDYGVSNFTIPGFIYGVVPAVTTSPFNGTSAFEGSMYITTNNYINITSSNFLTSWWTTGFTCEAWVNYPNFTTVANTATPSIPMTLGNINVSGSTNYWSLGPNQSSNLSFFYYNGTAVYVTGSNLMQPNTWYHIAVTYDLTTIRVFQNGILQNSAAVSGTPSTITIPNFGIGGQQNSTTVGNAYVTNVRLIYGTGLYTANFTPPTGPLNPASSGTTALLLRVPQNPGRLLIPKIGGTTQVQVYPPVALTGNFTNVKNTSYGSGYYSVTNSSEINTGFTGYLAFVYNGVTRWAPGNSPYSTVSPYNYTGNFSTIDIIGNTYNGDWLQIKIPVPIILYSYSFSSLASDIINTFYVLGSVDGIKWNTIDYNTAAAVGGTPVLFQINGNSISYQYYRFVITQAGGQITTSLYNCKLFGIQESINITPEGQVGIGITQPQQQLEVAGNAMFYGNISATNLGMFRNRIINGDMRIDQRYNGVGASNVEGGYSAVDRYQFVNSVGGNYNVQKISLGTSDTPNQYGFQNAIKLITTTANPVGGGTQTAWGQTIEDINMSDFQWGTQYAKPATLSFWCKTNFTGNVGTSILPLWVGGGGSEYYHYISLTSNVWQYINFVIPPPTSITTSSNLASCGIYIGSYTGAVGKTNNAWNNQFYIGSQEGTWCTTIGNSLTITGLQLEKGTIATPFEFRPYAIELQLCQRYFYGINTASGYVGIVYGDSSSLNANTKSVLIINLPQTMRIPPSFYNNNAVVNYDMTSYQGGVLSGLSNLSVATTKNLGVLSSSTSLTQGYCLAAVLISGNIGFHADF